MFLEDVSPDQTAVHIKAAFPNMVPQQLFNYFTQPDLLTVWWPQTALTHLREGGSYTLGWPEMNWTLRGTYTAVQPPSHLAFTWNWDHQPELPTRNVTLEIFPAEDGARLNLTQTAYASSEIDQTDRRDHINGWLHFLKILQSH